tara:strand:+ start:551 stop:721 length:171 start_codon:yes stop_codon:yes gene_type:complete
MTPVPFISIGDEEATSARLDVLRQRLIVGVEGGTLLLKRSLSTLKIVIKFYRHLLS